MPTPDQNLVEDQIEKIEELIVMGFHRPYQVQKMTGMTDWKTVKKYIAIAQRRLRHRYSTINYDEIRKKEIRSLDQMERVAWKEYHKKGQDEKTKALIFRNIRGVKERRAAMLGLDPAKAQINFNVNQDAKPKVIATHDEVIRLANVVQQVGRQLQGSLPDAGGTGQASDGSSGTGAPPVRTDVSPALHDKRPGGIPEGDSSPPDRPPGSDSGSA